MRKRTILTREFRKIFVIIVVKNSSFLYNRINGVE